MCVEISAMSLFNFSAIHRKCSVSHSQPFTYNLKILNNISFPVCGFNDPCNIFYFKRK